MTQQIISGVNRLTAVAFGLASPPTLNDFGGKSFYFNTSTRVLYGRSAGNAIYRVGPGGSVVTPTAGMVAPNNSLKVSDADYQRLYGPGRFRIDTLFNGDVVRRGGYDYAIAHRFRATKSARITTHKGYWSANSGSAVGYAGGNGGDIRARMFESNGDGSANLSGVTYGDFTYTPRSNSMSNGYYPSGAQGFFDLSFNNTQALTAGKLYNIVYENLNASPDVNWSSVNCIQSYAANGRSNRWLDPMDWALLVGYRPAGSTGAYTWSDRTLNAYTSSDGIPGYWSPILQLTYDDGEVFGCSVMESGNHEQPNAGKPIYRLTNGHIAREIFTFPAADKYVGVSLHLGCESAGTVRMVVYSPQGQQLFEMTKSFTPDVTWIGSGERFMSTPLKAFDFGGQQSFPAGNCAIDFEIQSGSFVMGVQRNGSLYGFKYPAAFTQSVSWVKQGGSFGKTNLWDHTSPSSGSIENWPLTLHRA